MSLTRSKQTRYLKAHTHMHTRMWLLAIVTQARPEKIVVVENGKIAFKTGIGPYQYSTSKLRTWLERKFPMRLTWTQYLVYGVL